MFPGISMSRNPMDMTTLHRPLLEHMAEGKMCVHSVYIPNCSGCRIRELERCLAIVNDTQAGDFTPDIPMHGFTFKDEREVWKYAKLVLKRAEEGD